ncbi:MAG: cytidylate kinase family protein [Parasporobacterium sp.]|nr:cytidylate kinase family protein [Parasporobacterium sp.]
MKEKFNLTLLIRKFIVLVAGLFILAFGIALSAKSGLGVSPSQSLSYILSLIAPLSMGTFTMIINLCLFAGQILILRKNFKLVHFLQLAVVFIFSYFTDLTLAVVAPLEISSYWARLLLSIVSCIIMAFGVFLEVKAGLIVMASEGFISALADKIRKDFGLTKIFVDWGFIVLSTILSLLCFRAFVGVREGTVIAAFLVGYCVRFYNKKIRFLDRFLESPTELMPENVYASLSCPLVITIERELGSGGHEIGEALAKRLGIKFYDYNLIAETAKAAGLPADDIEKSEERLGIGLLSNLSQGNYAMSQEESKEEAIFRAQVQVIREIAEKESCVIVGRLGSYILNGRPNTLNLFLSADLDFRAEQIAQKLKIPKEKARKMVKKEDSMRAKYCEHFTGMPWGLACHYGLAVHTSDYGLDNSVELILDAMEHATCKVESAAE